MCCRRMEHGLTFLAALNMIPELMNRSPALVPQYPDTVLRASSTRGADLIVRQDRWEPSIAHQIFLTEIFSGYWLTLFYWRHLATLSYMSRWSERDQRWLWWVSRTQGWSQEQNCWGDPEQKHRQRQESAQDNLQQWRAEVSSFICWKHQHWTTGAPDWKRQIQPSQTNNNNNTCSNLQQLPTEPVHKKTTETSTTTATTVPDSVPAESVQTTAAETSTTIPTAETPTTVSTTTASESILKKSTAVSATTTSKTIPASVPTTTTTAASTYSSS